MEGPELRDLPLELIRPNPEQPRTRFDPASITSLAASIADAGIVQPLIVRPLPRRPLRAHRRRAPVARGPRGRRADRAGDRPRRGRGGAAPDRADRERRPRGPQPDRRGTRVRRAGRGPGPLEGGAGPPPRPQPLGDLQPHPPARPARRGARSPRLGRAQRGPRPRDPPGAGQRGSAQPGARGRNARLVGPRDRASREGLREHRPRSSCPTRTRRPRSPAPRRRSSRRWAQASAFGPPAAGFASRCGSTTWTSCSRSLARDPSRLGARQGASRCDPPSRLRRAGRRRSGRAGGPPGPARTRSARAAPGSRPRMSGRGISLAGESVARLRDERVERLAIGDRLALGRRPRADLRLPRPA